ncbi:hypothetical protein SAMN05661010_02818 [Modicisalibacter muralis]|uniref:Ubiquinone biosynthesis accessory factor UbiK n=1 Tax=Modicisalibacter muralis TaxID=119000 RepID=A0A1G9NQR7_9GAMM|nr:accessory factor UbiK family protein [Halomonas muralis]SDL88729.1 hypothetical protein SAMN05661010_02818 [Halomonas muralis]
MASNDRIGRLARQLGERLQDASHAPEEIQRSVHNVMRGAFDRMELVSREDFDILMDVLQRTRTRVEALEKQVAALEAALDDEVSPSLPPEVVAADTAAPPEDSHAKKPPGDASTDNTSADDTAADKKTQRAKPADRKAR